jgi:predicted RND superfamily exporter protein
MRAFAAGAGGARLRALVPAATAVLCGAALAGLVLSHDTAVQSDLAALAPRGLPELRDVQRTERALGTGGVLRFAITGRDVLDPAVLSWQRAAARRVLAAEPRLRPGPNVAELLAAGASPTRADVDRLLGVLPRYFLDAVVTRGRTRGELSFGVPVAPVHEQARILARAQEAMGTPPAGVHVTPAGLVARGVQSVHDLEAARPGMLLIALAAVAALLLAVRRSVRRALVPLLPTLLAAGVTALALRIGGIVLSPLGAALEPLVLAVGVEFGLVLEARYAEARGTGLAPARAREVAVERVGSAIWVSALAAAVGFGALLASHMGLLQQFGALVAIEVLLCAALAVWIVPALSAALEERALQRERPRSAGAGSTSGPRVETVAP